MNEIIALTIVSGITGLISGIIGAGPEVLIVPLLTFMGIMPSIKHRIGTSLFMLLPPIGLFAALNYYKKGYVNIKNGIISSPQAIKLYNDCVNKLVDFRNIY